MKPSASKFVRSRSESNNFPSSPDPSAALAYGADWVGFTSKFEVVEDQVEMEGYQVYAVEKWQVHIVCLPYALS